MEKILTTEQLRDFLGAGEEHTAEVEMVRASAIEQINRATGIDWATRTETEAFNEALRVQVWISYYAVRDAAKNTVFLENYLTSLLCSLQLTPEETHDL